VGDKELNQAVFFRPGGKISLVGEIQAGDWTGQQLQEALIGCDGKSAKDTYMTVFVKEIRSCPVDPARRRQ
jgi:hypothetical protein